MAKSSSNTMELDSILQEARSRRGGQAPVRQEEVPETKEQTSFDDSFILTDDSYQSYAPEEEAPRPQKAAAAPKKKKTGLIVTLCIVGVLLIAAIGGAVWYMNSGSGSGPESTFADNVIVNGKSLKDMNMTQAKALMANVEKDMADAIKIEVKAGEKSFNLTKDDFKYSFDTEKVLNEAKAYSEEKGIKTGEKTYEITMTVDDSTCKDIITKIAGEVKTEAKDAEVTDFDTSADDMFTISDETVGTALNEKDSLAALSGFIKQGKTAGTVEAVVEEVKPTYTKAYLKDNIKELSTFTTTSTNNANGNENMRISLAACDGSVIEPGETWSFNACTGNSNLASNGYKPAGVIVNGRSETGIGGGICQSSTTIYNAAILCGMKVEERACHYYKSVYVDAGRDATIDYGNIDLKVSNPFDYQLFMKCWMDGTVLHCSIYGLPNPDFDEIDISTTSPSYFDRGYKVYTTRYYYKDGEEVGSDELPSSTYYTSAPSSGSSSSSSSDDDDDDDDTSSDSGTSAPDDSDSGSGDDSSDDPPAESPEPEAPVDVEVPADNPPEAPVEEG